MANREVSVDKELHLNTQTGWVSGWIAATAENKHMGRIEFNARNWEEFEILLGAAQRVKDVYAGGANGPIVGPDGKPRI